MALTALETSLILNEFMVVFKENTPFTREVMLAAGVAGEAAKSTDVQTVVATALANLYGQTAPTISP